MNEKPKLHVASWSGGKDSTATIILCHERGIPLDLILFSEVMYDVKRGISGEYPDQVAWMKSYAIPLFESWGYKVEVLHAENGYLQCFHRTISRGVAMGKLKGYVLSVACYANSELKVNPIRKRLASLRKDYELVQYIGIAADEEERLERMNKRGRGEISVLSECGVIEDDTYEICNRYGLLSPLYNNFRRGGCWFCPNARISQFANFARQMPELWEEFVQLGNTPNLVTTAFKKGGVTIFDVDRKVKAYIKNEDEQGRLFE